MLRAVLDTHQFISSLAFKRGHQAALLEAWKERRYLLLTSKFILAEIKRVFEYPKIAKKYNLRNSDLETLFDLLEHDAVMVPGLVKVDIIKEDPEDNFILACAIEGKADYLVSGDRHLLKLQQYEGTRIVTAAEFLKEINFI
jgi:putative PIN family toxin of toxin-antitoxin system